MSEKDELAELREWVEARANLLHGAVIFGDKRRRMQLAINNAALDEVLSIRGKIDRMIKERNT